MPSKEISTWLATASLPQFPKLTKDIETEVAIIGGGLAGLFSAYLLAKAGKKVVVLEKHRISRMGTGFTTGFLTQSIDTDTVDQVSMYGDKDTRRIWESHGKAIDLIEKIVRDEKIDCEFTRCTNYLYANDRKELKALEEEAREMRRLGFKASLTKRELGFKSRGALAIPDQGKYHAVKFVAGLCKALERMGVDIYEKTEVVEIQGSGKGRERFTVIAGKREIRADWTITATYQPFNNPKEVFLQKGMYVSYIIELEVPKGKYPEGTYEDLDNPYHYFRVDKGRGKNGKDRVLIGGEDHRKEVGTKKMEEKSFKALREYAQEVFGRKYPEVRQWSGYILEPVDGIAFIGEYDPRQLIATAFSGNGMTYSGISAMIFRDSIAGKKNPYIELYRPGRTPTLNQLWKKGRDFTEEFFRGAVANVFK
jgi:glycine/D-amino acid oxidase-like deaminating enzyme